MTLTGEFGARYRIEQSGGLMSWSALGSVTNNWSISQVTDAAATNHASRFYRVAEAP